MNKPPGRRRRGSTAGVAESGRPNAALADSERERLIATSLELIEKLYVHLPLKRSMYAVNPLQKLRLLQRRLRVPNTPQISDREFYNEMLSIFSQLRDLHTSFVLPEPLRSATAYLPFRMEACVEQARRIYLVSHVMPELSAAGPFGRGVEVTHWNGIPIDRAVALNAEREAGSNAAARHAQGLASMTIRWLGQSLPPDEEWVDVRYLSAPAAEPAEIRLQWQVFQQESAREHTVARAQGQRRLSLGMDARGEVERQVRRFLFGASPTRPSASRRLGSDRGVVSRTPDAFPSCRNVPTPHGAFAYVRIATFNVESDQAFLREFIRIVGQLSQDGLILDVRGNGGGLINAGERLLQLLTPRTIDPARFHFMNSSLTQQLSERHGFLRAWRESIAQAVETGAEYSQGFPLLPLPSYNDIGQVYQGPVVLVTDALCYSTTDIFAAGFQDHGIGTILGVDENTGAGGANVWEYPLISELVDDPDQFPASLPGRASFRFAVRRVTRVGANAGLPLEDLGVRPDSTHQITRRDLLERNLDLIDSAATLLAGLPNQRLTAAPDGRSGFLITCMNLDRVDAYLDDRPLSSRSVRARAFRLPVPASSRPPGAEQLCLQGFRQGQLVAATRVPLETEG